MARCSGCGQAADEAPPTWTAQTNRSGRQWLCERCTRDRLLSIESRIDDPWP